MSSLVKRPIQKADAVVATAVWLTAAVITAVFLWILSDLMLGGIGHLSFDFLVQAPSEGGRSGGIGPILVSTSLILMVCLITAVPLGLATAVVLAEMGTGRLAGLVRLSLDVLAGMPSIVFGLFGNIFFCQMLGLGYSILAGGLTLACMVLPIFIRSAEVGLRSVPDAQRQAAAALSMSRATTLWRVLIPGAMPGILVGLVLGVGRAGAETAALLFTSGEVDRMPESLLDSGRALSVHIYNLAMFVPGGDRHAYASALVLVSLLLMINLAASWISGRFLQSTHKD